MCYSCVLGKRGEVDTGHGAAAAIIESAAGQHRHTWVAARVRAGPGLPTPRRHHDGHVLWAGVPVNTAALVRRRAVGVEPRFNGHAVVAGVDVARLQDGAPRGRKRDTTAMVPTKPPDAFPTRSLRTSPAHSGSQLQKVFVSSNDPWWHRWCRDSLHRGPVHPDWQTHSKPLVFSSIVP